jgi:hypothetical protein
MSRSKGLQKAPRQISRRETALATAPPIYATASPGRSTPPITRRSAASREFRKRGRRQRRRMLVGPEGASPVRLPRPSQAGGRVVRQGPAAPLPITRARRSRRDPSDHARSSRPRPAAGQGTGRERHRPSHRSPTAPRGQGELERIHATGHDCHQEPNTAPVLGTERCAIRRCRPVPEDEAVARPRGRLVGVDAVAVRREPSTPRR